jgi:hypothetical protein
MTAKFWIVLVLFWTIVKTANASSPVHYTQIVLPLFTLQQDISSGVASSATPFTDKLLVEPNRGFVGTVQFSCPTTSSQGLQCSISPSALTMDETATAQAVTVSFSPVPSSTAFVFVPLFGVFCLARGRMRSAVTAVFILGFSVLLFGVVGCGAPVTRPYDPTSTGSYQIVVTGTSGTFAQSVSYQVSVK